MASDKEKVFIFDTTLRDGEQSPGATLNIQEKLEIAKQLAKLGVDIIEAGFPFSSPGDYEAVKLIGKEVQGPVICALARARKEDIDKAAGALESAKKKRIHTFIATSDIHIEHKLKTTREKVLKTAVEMVRYAKSFTDNVEFSPEDAGRSDPKFLFEILEATIEVGATTVNIPDTVGYTVPSEFGGLIKAIKENVPNINKAVISVHCHNDLGLAVANSLSAVVNGARQVECTINGIGERAGNCSLEEIVMILKTRPTLGLHTDIDSTQIYRSSRLVSTLTNMLVQPNKAIVGANAFAHESGIHQDGFLKYKRTYEIMNPEDVGLLTSKLPLGPRSGRHALKEKLSELGYHLNEEQLDKAFIRFKEIADKKKQVVDRDLESIIRDEQRIAETTSHYELENLQIACGTGLPTASVCLRRTSDNVFLKDSALGTGPVDAIYKTINKIVQIPNELIEFSVQSVTEGIDALGEVTIRIQQDSLIYNGHAANTDITIASAKAYLNALNKLIDAINRGEKILAQKEELKSKKGV
ncbi:MAG: 2-isopropylmalate synthase [Candidatus Melainabacteria bacterium]|nr:2-isopropylmalate synthase [Candidatus Melainabacteria bacterium]